MKKLLTVILLVCSLCSVTSYAAEKAEIFHLGFEETGGILVYDSVNGEMGTIDKAERISARCGKALSFEKDSKPVGFDATSAVEALNGRNGIGISFWLRREGGNDFDILSVKYEDNKLLSVSCNKGSLCTDFKISPYDSVYSVSAGVVSDYDWEHYAININIRNKCVEVYKNGAVAGIREGLNFQSEEFISPKKEYRIITGAPGISLDEVRLYNYVLTEEEIYKEMNRTDAKESKSSLTPVAEWDFDEATDSEVVKDGGIHGIDGRIINGYITEEGVSGNAITFDPTSPGYVDLGTRLPGLLDKKEGLTVTMWIQPKQMAATYNQNNLFTLYNGDDYGFFMRVRCQKPYFMARSCPEDKFLNTASSLIGQLTEPELYWVQYNQGIWYHVACVADYKNKTMKTYVNGEELEWPNKDEVAFLSDTFVFDESTVLPVTIGGEPNFMYSMGGCIDEVKVFDKALAAEEVNVIYNEFNGALSAREKEQLLIGETNSFMKDSLILCTGSGNVLKNGRFHKINPDNYNAVTILSDGTAYVPAELFERHMDCRIKYGEGVLTVQKDEYTAMVGYLERDGITLVPLRETAEAIGRDIFWDDSGIIIIPDEGVYPDKDKNRDMLECIYEGFNNKWVEEPVRNHEQSRAVVEYVKPVRGDRTCAQAPSIVKLKTGEILVSLSYYGNVARLGTPPGISIFASYDNGKTFERISNVTQVATGSLVEVGDDVYILGHNPNAKVALSVAKSTDKGKTWTTPLDSKTGRIKPGELEGSHIGPTGVLIADGRIYRAVEQNAWKQGQWKTFMMSAPVDSDLLDSDSWTMTNRLTFDPIWINADKPSINPGWLEGTPVKAPDGSIKNILRINALPLFDIAALVDVSQDSTECTFDPEEGLIDFPGGSSLFVVKYDEVSGYYIALVNPINVPYNWYSLPRNYLSLSVSKDLKNWEVVENILVDRDLINYEESLVRHSFQYVNWQFDGDDIIMVVRECAEDSSNYHDANYITFYRLKNFREYIKEK